MEYGYSAMSKTQSYFQEPDSFQNLNITTSNFCKLRCRILKEPSYISSSLILKLWPCYIIFKILPFMIAIDMVN